MPYEFTQKGLEVQEEVRQFMADAGYAVYPHHTGHGVGVFFYWLYLAQGALLLALAATQTQPRPRLTFAWLGSAARSRPWRSPPKRG